MRNVNTYDRFFRLFLAIVALELAFFWTTGWLQGAACAIAGLMALTGLFTFCPAYYVLRVSTCSVGARPVSRALQVVFVLVLLLTLVGGSYASALLSRKLFLEEFNAMNHFYKQTLFLTGKNQRQQAQESYEKLVPAYTVFQAKYTRYQPYALRADTQLASDLDHIAAIMAGVANPLQTADLAQVHLDLEKIRPLFQDIFKRNGFSMLSVALVDFHDAMEVLLEAAKAQDVAKTLQAYAQADETMKAVEAQSHDADIQLIRKSLDALQAAAKDGARTDLPSLAGQLKSSFIPVYLQRG